MEHIYICNCGKISDEGPDMILHHVRGCVEESELIHVHNVSWINLDRLRVLARRRRSSGRISDYLSVD